MSKCTVHIQYLKTEVSIIDQFIEAAKRCDVDLLNRLLHNIPREIKDEIIAHNDYEIFVWAANNGCIKLLDKLLKEVNPKQKQCMIMGNNFEALECAVINDHIHIVKKLLEVAAPEQRSSMVAISADIALKRGISDMLEAILAYANEEEKSIILEEAMEQGMIEGNHSMY